MKANSFELRCAFRFVLHNFGCVVVFLRPTVQDSRSMTYIESDLFGKWFGSHYDADIIRIVIAIFTNKRILSPNKMTIMYLIKLLLCLHRRLNKMLWLCAMPRTHTNLNRVVNANELSHGWIAVALKWKRYAHSWSGTIDENVES